MHFALPTKDHRSSPLRSTTAVSRTYLRNILRRPMSLLIGIVVILFLYLGLSRRDGGVRYGNPPGVVVTVIDRANYSQDHLDRVIENRKEYAKLHGMLKRASREYLQWGLTAMPRLQCLH